MNTPYTPQQLAAEVAKLKDRFPGMAEDTMTMAAEANLYNAWRQLRMYAHIDVIDLPDGRHTQADVMLRFWTFPPNERRGVVNLVELSDAEARELADAIDARFNLKALEAAEAAAAASVPPPVPWTPSGAEIDAEVERLLAGHATGAGSDWRNAAINNLIIEHLGHTQATERGGQQQPASDTGSWQTAALDMLHGDEPAAARHEAPRHTELDGPLP